MTPEQLAEIEARLRAATPGPWTLFGEALYLAVMPTGFGRVCDDHQSRVDAEFIANAPADIAALLAEVEKAACFAARHCVCP